METNNASALYSVIFETITALKRDKDPMDLARAKAISGAVQTAVNLAKVEVDHMKATKSNHVPFFDDKKTNELPPGKQSLAELAAQTSVKTHRVRG